jgi:hypothetical protein
LEEQEKQEIAFGQSQAQQETANSSTSSASALNTCGEHCVFEGRTETCKEHLQRVAYQEFLGDPRSCARARDVAIKRCPICGQCSMEAAGCQILAPVTTPKPPEKNCDNVCGFDGKFVTCKVRIQWASSNTFQFREESCRLGHDLVQKQCVACQTCPLEKANCTDSDAVAAGLTPPPSMPSPYDCEKGLSNWQMGWTQDKSAWCCKHQGKGCPMASVDHDGPREKPKHECLKDLGHSQDDWDDEKRAWCCEHEHLGCSAHAIFKKFDNHPGSPQTGAQLRKPSPSFRGTLVVLALMSAAGLLVLLAVLSFVRHCSRVTVTTAVIKAQRSYSRELMGCNKDGGSALALE